MNQFLILLMLLLLPACQPTDEPSDVEGKFWRLKLSTSGGITGGGGGVEVWSDGSVFERQWGQAGGEESCEFTGQISSEAVQELAAKLQEAKNIKHSEYANMTTSLSLIVDQEAPVFWSWESGSSNSPRLLRELSELLPGFAPERKEGGSPSFDSDVSSEFQARVLVPQGPTGASLTIHTKSGELEFETENKPGSILGLKGTSWTSRDKGTLEIDEVKGAWISGTLEKDGKKSSFRLPVWFEVAP